MADIACWAFVPAAGSGERMGPGRRKQYLPLLGKPLVLHALETLLAHPAVRGVLVGVAADDPEWAQVAPRHEKMLGQTRGADSRAGTVLAGLEGLARYAAAADWVMVHDGARPCLTGEDVDRLLEALGADADGVVPGVPVAETVKRAGDDGIVAETVPRHGLWLAQTPQVFRLGELTTALESALAQGAGITDEASAMERAGFRVRMVEGRRGNIKVTCPGDLVLARHFLADHRNGA